VQSFASRAGEKGIVLEASIDPGLPGFVVGDPPRLRQVLLNLVGNAVKFTDHGEVRLRVHVEPETLRVRFAVSDTGIGIPHDQLDAVFERFVQVHSSDSRKFGGSGLGLTIVKGLVERMGGQVAVTSEVGKGTSFSFAVELPPGASTIEEDASPPAGVGHGDGDIRILVVDDDENNRRLVELFLRDASCRLDFAENGEAALRRFASDPGYDLVLMDLLMPVKDGYAATREIREWEARNGRYPVPIIALTACAEAEHIERSRVAGCTAHVAKPIKKQDLHTIIRTYRLRGGDPPKARG
jgi:CheY-like chemotaxis protein